MGLYAERVFLPVMERVLDTPDLRSIRARVCAPLAGEVVELGFGTGLNLPHLPEAVTRLLAVEPLGRGRHLAAERLAASAVPVEFIGIDGEHLPLDDASVDSALVTWTLCSITDPVAAVREVARVLRPGGCLAFVEHGLAPDERTRRRQRRLDPLQRVFACGCHLTREPAGLLRAGGLELDRLDRYAVEGEPRTHGWTSEGLAIRPQPQ